MEKEKTENDKHDLEGKQLTDDELENVTGGMKKNLCYDRKSKEECQSSGGVVGIRYKQCEWYTRWGKEYCG